MRFRAWVAEGSASPVAFGPLKTWFVACTAAVLLAACGGSGHKNKTASARGSTASIDRAANTTPSRPPDGLLSSGELAGFTPGVVTVYRSVGQWVSNPSDQQSASQAAAEKSMLLREGFRAGAAEFLSTNRTVNDGLSIDQQFLSSPGARGALAYYISNQKKPQVQASEGKYASFRVRGIPGAVGFSLGGAAGGINIAFAYRDNYYLVGREGGTRRDIAGLSAAARHLYRRIRG